MVEVAHAILEAKNEVLDFNQLLVEIHLEITVGDYALGIQSILSMKKLQHLWKTKK